MAWGNTTTSLFNLLVLIGGVAILVIITFAAFCKDCMKKKPMKNSE